MGFVVGVKGFVIGVKVFVPTIEPLNWDAACAHIHESYLDPKLTFFLKLQNTYMRIIGYQNDTNIEYLGFVVGTYGQPSICCYFGGADYEPKLVSNAKIKHYDKFGNLPENIYVSRGTSRWLSCSHNGYFFGMKVQVWQANML